ncbi:MAG: ABC-type transport auxiliary lipoprotein family protein [Pseudomonadota bacterium]
MHANIHMDIEDDVQNDVGSQIGPTLLSPVATGVDQGRQMTAVKVSRSACGWRKFAIIGVATIMLGGCSILALESAPQVYDLRAPQTIDVGGASTSRQLLVAEPTSVRFYATDRIVVRDSAATLAYFPGALWSDVLPDLFQARFAEALERTGKVRAVGRPGQGLLIDVRLVPEIRAFEVEIGGEGRATAVIDIDLKLMNDANGRIIAGQSFRVRQPARDDSAAAGAQALNAALDLLLSEMVVFVLGRV